MSTYFAFRCGNNGFTGGASGNEPACQCRRRKRGGFHSQIRRVPWRRAWQPTPVFLPVEFHGRGPNVGEPGLIPGLGRSPGEGNGYPLQYSCLENSMDRGACQDTVHWVAKNQT